MRGLAPLALLSVLVLLAAACASSESGSTATVGPTPSPTSHPELPDILSDASVLELRQGSPQPIPGDTALILETGCFQCEGPATGLIRVYTRADGSPVVDTLLDPTTLGLGPRRIATPNGVEEGDPVITGFALSDDAGEIMVSVCARESCGSGGLDAWSPGSQTAIFRSTDGGVTWTRAGTVDSGGFVIQLLGEGRAVIGTWDVDGGPLTLRTFPEMEKMEPPRPRAWPVIVLDRGIVWRSVEGRALLGSDGEEIIDFGPGAEISRVSGGGSGPRDLIVMWVWEYRYFLSLLDGGGGPLTTYEYPRFMMLSPAGFLKGLAIGNAEMDVSLLPQPLPGFSYLPAVFDFPAGTVRPILDPFAQAGFPIGRNHVVGVTRGFFSRVRTPGSCLDVRAEPSRTAITLECAADGVLLRGTGLSHAAETREAEGVTWLHVLTPAGVEGWAETALLES